MVDPKFEIGDKLISYKLEHLGSGRWRVEGENSSGKFSVTYNKGEQHLHGGASCLNWREVTD